MDELAATRNQKEVSSGRLQLDYDNQDAVEASQFARWLGQRGIRSLGLLVWEGQLLDLMGEENVCIICDRITSQVLDGIETNKATNLEAWHLFGNAKYAATEPYYVYVSCQKLHSPNTSCQFYDNLSTTQLATQIVRGCQQQFQWEPEPKKQKAQLRLRIVLSLCNENNLNIRVELITLKVPSEHQGNQELPHPGMKRIEAWAVVKSANIPPAVPMVVMDPMCGKGSFLIEAATFFPSCRCLGVDSDRQQLEYTRINVQAMGLQDKVRLFQGDSRDISHVESHSVDRILCCPPFGRQFSREAFQQQEGSLLDFYQELLKEWNRLLKVDTGSMILLIDEDNLKDLTKAIQEETNCVITCQRRFRLGNLQCFIVVADAARDQDNKKISPSSELPWERDSSGMKMDTRTLWAQLRASELPSLVPVAQASMNII